MSKYQRKEPKRPGGRRDAKKYASGPTSEEAARGTDRVVLRLPPALADELRVRAAAANVTISGYIAERLRLESSHRFGPDQGHSSNRPDLEARRLLLQRLRALGPIVAARLVKGDMTRQAYQEARKLIQEEFRTFAVEDFRNHVAPTRAPKRAASGDPLLDQHLLDRDVLDHALRDYRAPKS